MEKRLFIAVMISIAFLFAWGALMPRLFPDLGKPKQTTPATTTATATTASTDTVPSTATQAAIPPRITETPNTPAQPPLAAQSESRLIETVVKTDEYVARFSNR